MRINFKQEFTGQILGGQKRFTSRWNRPNFMAGDILAAVAGIGRPAFLTPTKDAFAKIRITSVQAIPWHEFTDADAADCGVTRDWYTNRRPLTEPFDTIYKIGFEIIGNEAKK